MNREIYGISSNDDLILINRRKKRTGRNFISSYRSDDDDDVVNRGGFKILVTFPHLLNFFKALELYRVKKWYHLRMNFVSVKMKRGTKITVKLLSVVNAWNEMLEWLSLIPRHLEIYFFRRIFMSKIFQRTFLSEYLLWKYFHDADASNDDYAGDEGKENLIAKTSSSHGAFSLIPFCSCLT